MTPAAAAKRLAELEAEAHTLLPKTSPPFEEGGWLKWLTCAELDRLGLLLARQDEAGEAVAAVPEHLYRRALGRAVMDVDMAQIDAQEAASGVLVGMQNPDRPGNPLSVLYAAYTPDAVDRDQWHLDAAYAAQSEGRLPLVLSTAQIEQLEPRPWPPRGP
jgi:hypothetical protein